MANTGYDWPTRTPRNTTSRSARSSPLATRSLASPANARSPATDAIRSSPGPSPDIPSPVHSDRYIRPLPKRKLRDRLSAEQADSWTVPKAPERKQLFQFPYPRQQTREEQFATRLAIRGGRTHPPGNWQNEERDIEDDEYVLKGNAAQYARVSQKIAVNGNRPLQRQPGRGNVQYKERRGSRDRRSMTGSVGSSADGDEGFENTNNKKKRKIPQANGGGLGHFSASADFVSAQPLPREDETQSTGEVASADRTGTYYGTGAAVPPALSTGSSTNPVALPTRGRSSKSGRTSSERRPLGNSTNGVNYGQSTPRRVSSPKSHVSSQANYSTPKASATESNGPELSSRYSPKGKQSATATNPEQPDKDSPQSSNFTFTCDAPSSSKLVWPGNTNVSTNGRYAYPESRRGQQAPYSDMAPPPASRPRKKLTRDEKRKRVIKKGAQLRKQTQSLERTPLGREDVWICEYCEYEAIFGQPPIHLMYQYEKKELRIAKQKEERRRTLEKIKNKKKAGNKTDPKASKDAIARQAAQFQKQEYLNNVPPPPSHDPTQGDQYDPRLHTGVPNEYPDDYQYDGYDEDYLTDEHLEPPETEDEFYDDDADYYEDDVQDDLPEVPPPLPPNRVVARGHPPPTAGPAGRHLPTETPYVK